MSQRPPRTYRVGTATRLVNRFFAMLTRHGRGAAYRHELTVVGRTSGRPRTVPVDVMDVDGVRHLVAAYGEVSWVHNARAAGTVTLSRGGASSRWRVTELHGVEAVPAVRQYLAQVPVTAPYWEVTADSSDEEIAAAVARHPVFRLAPD